jgi:hypothetical protein
MSSWSPAAARRCWVIVAVLGALGACAGVPPPTDAISQAELALQQAETAQAAVHAPGDLLRAREQLESAQAAMRNEEYDNARRLAEQSTADAQVAIAKSRAAVAAAAEKAAQESMSALRQQTAPGPASPAAVTTPLTP